MRDVQSNGQRLFKSGSVVDKRLIDIYKTKRKFESHCDQSILEVDNINKFLRAQRQPKVHSEKTAPGDSECSARSD